MPWSKALRSRSRPTSRFFMPHQLVPTVQTPKPTVETVMSVPLICLYSMLLLPKRLVVDADLLAPGAIGGGHDLRGLDFAAAAPEHVRVAHGYTQGRQVLVDRRFMSHDQVFVEAVRHRHHVDVT